eukprot:7358447-Alexandrium_andersonii.AAC.1
MPEAKAALAVLRAHSKHCLDQMHDLVKKRTESPSVPLSLSVSHFVDSVGKGNRTERFVHIEASAMHTVRGSKKWAEHALRVIKRKPSERAQC